MSTQKKTADRPHFKTVLLVEKPPTRQERSMPHYQHAEWKVQPRSVFEYDPLEEGIESVSLGYLHHQSEKTVYEGYGKQDYYQKCSRKVKGIDPKPAISWMHGGQTRWSNIARLADSTSKLSHSSVHINGVPVDINEMLANFHVPVPEAECAKSSQCWRSNCVTERSTEQRCSKVTTSSFEQRRYESSTDTEAADFVELPPRLPSLGSSKVRVYSPAPYQGQPLKVDQPFYKNFNRSPTPFGISR